MKKYAATSTSFDGKIAFTANGVAYRRTFTAIPFSKTIYKIVEEITGPFDPKEKAWADSHPQIIPFFEACYMMTNQIIKKSRTTQILEIAPGLSPRGLLWSRDNPHGYYVELDLKPRSMLKQKVLVQIFGENMLGPRNLIIEEGDAKNSRDFDGTLDYFNDDEPVTIVCEGLLRYMSLAHKKMLATNIRRCLENYGGMWIIPDIELLCDVNASADMKKRYAATAKDWGIDVRPNLFKNLGHAYSFFEKFGFEVTVKCLADMTPKLVSPKKLGLDAATVYDDLKNRYAFIMSL